jgi:hypothetical protein
MMLMTSGARLAFLRNRHLRRALLNPRAAASTTASALASTQRLIHLCDTPGGSTTVPDEEIIKGYEHAKGHYVLIERKEIDELKLEFRLCLTCVEPSYVDVKTPHRFARSPLLRPRSP